MKKLLIILMILTLGTFLACGNDEGDGQVSISMETEDGLENLGTLIEPADPDLSIPGGTPLNPPYITHIQVLAYANGKVQPSNLIMNQIIQSTALVTKDYFAMDVPSGRDLIFIVNAVDKDRFIIYSGKAGPLSIRPRSIIPINVTLKKVDTSSLKSTSDNLRLYSLYNTAEDFNNELVRFGLSSANIDVRIYTQAEKKDYGWVPGGEITLTSEGTYGTTSGTRITGVSYLTNFFQLITVIVRTSGTDDGVAFYGARLYNGSYSENPITIYMQHPSVLAVTLSGNYTALSNDFRIQMDINNDGNWRPLYINGQGKVSQYDPDISNPVYVVAPSGEAWFKENSTVNDRKIRVQYSTGSIWGPAYTNIQLDFGVKSVVITGP